jgi:hypothetical protein
VFTAQFTRSGIQKYKLKIVNHGEFRTVRGKKATDLDGRDNLYVHCVWKERLELLREGMSNF